MKESLKKYKQKIQKYTPQLWILAGVLFLLPSILGSSKNHTSVGVGMMFIILGITFYKKK